MEQDRSGTEWIPEFLEWTFSEKWIDATPVASGVHALAGKVLEMHPRRDAGRPLRARRPMKA